MKLGRWAGMALVVTLGVAAPACGNDGSSRTKTSTTSDPSAQSYIGLTAKEAAAKAEAEDTPWRIVREDDESFPVTQDFVQDRVNFEIDNGKVTKVTYG